MMIDDANTATPTLTPNYVSSIATYKNVGFIDHPVLQLTALPVMEFEGNTNGSNSNKTHFTHLRLRDGSDDQMIGRLSVHLAHEGNRLREGDIIRLQLFTPCTYPTSGEDNPQRSPMVVIHQYSVVGTAALPERLPAPMHCAPLTDEQIEEYCERVDNLPAGRPDAAAEGETKRSSME